MHRIIVNLIHRYSLGVWGLVETVRQAAGKHRP
jgi:hypothetical protein